MTLEKSLPSYDGYFDILEADKKYDF